MNSSNQIQKYLNATGKGFKLQWHKENTNPIHFHLNEFSKYSRFFTVLRCDRKQTNSFSQLLIILTNLHREKKVKNIPLLANGFLIRGILPLKNFRYGARQKNLLIMEQLTHRKTYAAINPIFFSLDLSSVTVVNQIANSYQI